LLVSIADAARLTPAASPKSRFELPADHVRPVDRCFADGMEWLLVADTVEKVKNRTTSKISQSIFFGDSTAAMLRSVGTKLHGRFSEKRRGPSRRRA